MEKAIEELKQTVDRIEENVESKDDRDKIILDMLNRIEWKLHDRG